MRISDNGLALITEFEGFEAVAYLCPADVPTIGYGHTKTVDRSEVGKRKITKAMALTLLRDDCRDAEDAVLKLKVRLSQNQFDALVSLVFNCGPAPLKGGLGKALKAGRYDLVPAQFMRWTRASVQEKQGGKIVKVMKVLKGLERRRRAELAVWRGLDDGDEDDVSFIKAGLIEAVDAKPIENTGIRRASVAAGTAVTTLVGSNFSEISENAEHAKSLFEIVESFGITSTIAVIALIAALGWIAYRAYRDRDAI